MDGEGLLSMDSIIETIEHPDCSEYSQVPCLQASWSPSKDISWMISKFSTGKNSLESQTLTFYSTTGRSNALNVYPYYPTHLFLPAFYSRMRIHNIFRIKKLPGVCFSNTLTIHGVDLEKQQSSEKIFSKICSMMWILHSAPCALKKRCRNN